MTSGAFAVTLTAWRAGSKRVALAFGLVTAVFVYALVANEIQRPDGIMIASFFIGAIVVTSVISRLWRTTELRTERIELDEAAQRFVDENSEAGDVHLLAHRPHEIGDDSEEYASSEKSSARTTTSPRTCRSSFWR